MSKRDIDRQFRMATRALNLWPRDIERMLKTAWLQSVARYLEHLSRHDALWRLRMGTKITVRRGAAVQMPLPSQVVEEAPGTVMPDLNLEDLMTPDAAAAPAMLDLSGMGVDAATEQQTSYPPLGLTEAEVREQLGLLGTPAAAPSDLSEVKTTLYTISSTVAYVKQMMDQRMATMDARMADMEKLCADMPTAHVQMMDRLLDVDKRLTCVGEMVMDLMERVLKMQAPAPDENAPAKERAPRKTKDPFSLTEEQKVMDIITQVPMNTRFPAGQLAARISGATGVTADAVLAIWHKHKLVDPDTSEFCRMA